MARKHVLALGLSLALHAVLVTATLLSRPSVPPSVRPSLPSEVGMTVDLVEPSTRISVDTNAQAGNSSPTATNDSQQTTKLSFQFGGDFVQQTLKNRFAQPTEEDDDSAQTDAIGHGWSLAAQETNKMTIQRTFETLPFFMTLHNRVNSVLVYPDDFSRQRITGRVRIEAELNRDGTLKRFLTSTADDRLLQTYCFALLLQALSRPLPPRAHLPEGHPQDGNTIAASFDFEFHTRLVGTPRRSFPMVIQKNHLAFGRENEVDPIVTERIQEIFTHYVPPIVPLPGGVYIDFVMAYQFIQNILNDAPIEREMRQSRIETLHENLRRFVKIGSSPTPTATPES